MIAGPRFSMIATTGNGVAWPRELRSPGGGDNLYPSILAFDARSGE
jgi:hypothetical protein